MGWHGLAWGWHGVDIGLVVFCGDDLVGGVTVGLAGAVVSVLLGVALQWVSVRILLLCPSPPPCAAS